MTNIVGWSVGGVKGVHWTRSSVQNTTDGDRAIDLQGLDGPPFSSLSTTIPTIPGAPYSLSFDSSPGNTPNSAVVSCGSLTNQSFSGVVNPLGQPSVFTHYNFTFTALSSATTVLFQVTDSDGYGPVIDRVSVESLRPYLTIRVSQVELCWDTHTNSWYQLQYRSALTTNQWTPLTPTWLAGTGATYCTNDAVVVGQSQRFYKVAVTNSP
jgi:hypothetical protein